MRTKFRFQEQLEIYISKNYIAKELGSIAPCAMVASQPLNAVVEERKKDKDDVASKKRKSALSEIGSIFGGSRTKSKNDSVSFATKADRNADIIMPSMAAPMPYAESAEEYDYVEEEDSYEIFTGETELEKRMQHISDSFGRYMMYLVEAKGKTSTEVQNEAWITRKVYSKINTNQDSYHPDKRTAFQICVGLGLNMDETKDLIRRAGYDFSPSEKEDVIWSFFFEREPIDYDIFDISDALEKYGLKPIVVLKSGYEKV